MKRQDQHRTAFICRLSPSFPFSTFRRVKWQSSTLRKLPWLCPCPWIAECTIHPVLQVAWHKHQPSNIWSSNDCSDKALPSIHYLSFSHYVVLFFLYFLYFWQADSIRNVVLRCAGAAVRQSAVFEDTLWFIRWRVYQASLWFAFKKIQCVIDSS